MDVCFTLVKGPSTLERRVALTLSAEGAPLRIGRHLDSDCVLDKQLVFASGAHCTLYHAPATAPVGSERYHASEDGAAALRKSPAPSVGRRQDLGSWTPSSDSGAASSEVETHSQDGGGRAAVFIIDNESSNGTFVNRMRISCNTPHELKHGDTIIFGGTRDTAWGETMAPEVASAPEIVEWQVMLAGGACSALEPSLEPPASVQQATPARRLEREKREKEVAIALLEAVRQSLQQQQDSLAPAPTPDAQPREWNGQTPMQDRPHTHGDARPFPPTELRRQRVEEVGLGLESPEVRLGSGLPAGTAAATHSAGEEARQLHSELNAARDVLTELLESPNAMLRPRSTTVATRVSRRASDSLPQSAASAAAPLPLPFSTVRCGRHTFHVPTAAPLPDSGKPAAPLVETARTTCTRRRGVQRPAGKRRREQATRAAEPHEPMEELSGLVPSSAYALRVTPTHLKWVMDNPCRSIVAIGEGNRDSMAPEAPLTTQMDPDAPFHALLPLTSISRILLCSSTRTMVAVLRAGCRVPRVDDRVFSGLKFIAWQISVDAETFESLTRDVDAFVASHHKAAQLHRVPEAEVNQVVHQAASATAADAAASAGEAVEQVGRMVHLQ